MELRPLSDPRLSGKLLYSWPHHWVVVDTPDSLEIVPAETPRGFVMYFFVLAAASLAGAAALPFVPDFPQKWVACFAAAVLAVAFILCGRWVRARFVREQDLGQTLLISHSARTVELPREDKVWPFDRIVQCEIVSDIFTRDENGEARLFDDISELQLVVENDDGSRSAWPVVGAQGSSDRELESAGERVANAMNVKLVIDRKPV